VGFDHIGRLVGFSVALLVVCFGGWGGILALFDLCAVFSIFLGGLVVVRYGLGCFFFVDDLVVLC